jgi:hypothetical protein
MSEQDKSCDNCIHKGICEIVSAVRSVMFERGYNSKEKQAILKRGIADSCTYYLSIEKVKIE